MTLCETPGASVTNDPEAQGLLPGPGRSQVSKPSAGLGWGTRILSPDLAAPVTSQNPSGPPSQTHQVRFAENKKRGKKK